MNNFTKTIGWLIIILVNIADGHVPILVNNYDYLVV